MNDSTARKDTIETTSLNANGGRQYLLESLAVVTEFATLVRAGEYDNGHFYRDLLFQNSWARDLTRFELILFARVLDVAERGEVSITHLPMFRGPSTNDDTVGNNECLQRMALHMTKEFGLNIEGLFTGEPYGPDGFVAIPDGVKGQRFVDDPGGWQSIEMPAGHYPLEVGTLNASSTFDRLVQTGRLARWAYGMDKLTLLSLSFEAQKDLRFPLHRRRNPGMSHRPRLTKAFTVRRRIL